MPGTHVRWRFTERQRRRSRGFLRSLEPIGDQDATLRAHGGLAVLGSDAAAELDNVAVELLIRINSDHEPFQPNCFVSIDRATEADPELQAHHRTCLLYTSPSPRDGLLSRMPS